MLTTAHIDRYACDYNTGHIIQNLRTFHYENDLITGLVYRNSTRSFSWHYHHLSRL